MAYDIRHARMDDDGCPNFRRKSQPDRKSYGRGTIIADYLDNIRMSGDGCPNDIPRYIADRKRK